MISAFLFAVAFIYLQFQNYSHRQQMINETKWFNITSIGNESYVLLAYNGDLIQMNRCRLYKGILYISLDNVLIRNMNGVIYQTMYINRFEKICNGAICTEHYKARYRDGFN